MGRKEDIKRKMFLEELPRYKSGRLEGCIDWKESTGYKVNFIYDDIEGEIEIIDYVVKNQTLTIKYKDNKLFKIRTGNFQKCKIARLLNKITNEFRIEIGQIFKDNKRNMVIIDRKYYFDKRNQNRRIYKYKCNKCGYNEGWIEEAGLLRGNGCVCCCPNPQVVVENINSIVTTDPWMVKYFQGGYDEAKLYTSRSGQKIKPVCPNCGRVKDKEICVYSIRANKSIGCSCGDGQSYPNKFMFSVLEQLKIDFTSEYSPDWIGLKRYDFYFELESNKYIIEMDGGWHKIDNKMSGITAKEAKVDDNYKDMMANKYNIEVIRIDSNVSELEYIKGNIINSKLIKLFDLSTIDWIKVEEFALSSRVKEACEIKRDNPDYSTIDIAKMMNVDCSTIMEYLKKGSKIWDWINYDPKEEKEKSRAKAIESTKKHAQNP